MATRTSTSTPRKPRARRVSKAETRRGEPLLMEIAWEVCNQLGGIYTVIRSKVPSMVEQWGNRYVLVGPYTENAMATEFEPAPLTGAIGQVVKQMRELGIGAHYGRWLVTGRPHGGAAELSGRLSRTFTRSSTDSMSIMASASPDE